MTEEQDAKDSQSDSDNKALGVKSKDKKLKTQRPLTKIIIRRLPASMIEESFIEQVSPIPDYDFFYFAKPDLSLGNNVFSRAYINFVNVEDIFIFRDKFDGYVFLDEKGVEYVSIVEYAPFQRIPKKKKKKDPKCGTIESDPIYQEFLESLNKEQQTDNQPKLEYSYPVNDVTDKKVQTTPLLEYLATRKLDKRGREERRRRENDKRKMRIERKMKENPIKEEETPDSVKKSKPRDWDKEYENNDKYEQDISKSHEGIVFESKTYKEQRKFSQNYSVDKRNKQDDEKVVGYINEQINEDNDSEKNYSKDKYEKPNRDSKIKKYSDTRKERFKQTESNKNEEKAVESKSKIKNYDDIKPFTQLPSVKTDDITKIIDDMNKKNKPDDKKEVSKSPYHEEKDISFPDKSDTSPKVRRNSLESGEMQHKEEFTLKRQKSLDNRSQSTEREDSEEKEKSESVDRRTERRIRNKDRPSLVIYQPGMGKFSKQRLAKEKDTLPITKSINDNEKSDT